MRYAIPLLSLAVLLLATPSASAAQASGQLASDAPVDLYGSGTVKAPQVTVHHYATQDGSVDASVLGGSLVEESLFHVEGEGISAACYDRYESYTERRPIFTADPAKPFEQTRLRLLTGAIAQLRFANDLEFHLTAYGETPTQDQLFARVGPNPYAYERQQPPATAVVDDSSAPVFPVRPFVTVPTSSFTTLDPFMLSAYAGTLEVIHDKMPGEPRATYAAGVIHETREADNPDPNPFASETIECKVRIVRTYVLDATIALSVVGQEGAERPDAFWAGNDPEEVFGEGDGIPPHGYWSRERGPDLGAALERLHLPATVVTGEDMTLAVGGAAQFRRAVGSITAGDDLHEANEEDVTLEGNLDLQPVASEDGRRMSTKIGNDVSDVEFGGGVSSPGPWRTSTAIAAGAAAGLAGAGLGYYFWPTLKLGATKFLLFPLYARLRREDILENPLRDDILEAVESSPGISASELGRRLACGWGTLVYHLTVLERMQLLSSAREGRHKRFFVQGRINYSDKGAVGLLANASAKTILDAIRETPGVIQRDLGRRLSLSPGTVAWHVDRLAQAGLVVREEEGRVVRYYPSQRLHELTKQLAA